MTLIALGFDRLSMPASGIGPVKRMVRSMDFAHAARFVEEASGAPATSIRQDLLTFAQREGVML
jgi:phosphotransferase system enzyme I (PtsP)